MKVLVQSRDDCSYCEKAKGMLQALGVEYNEEYKSEGRVPQIFINDEHIGGYDELSELIFDEDEWNKIIQG